MSRSARSSTRANGAAFDRYAGSRQLLARAAESTPGGVHSNIRLHERPLPLFFDSADGPYLTDVDGNRYIDFVMGQGPMLLGHRPAIVLRAVVDQLGKGLMYAGQHRLEIEAAEIVRELVPCAEMVRFNVTGTEAVQAALRLARATTGRSVILKFQGHYHGWADNVAFSLGRRAPEGQALRAVAESAGIPDDVGRQLMVTEWNDPEAFDAVVREHGSSIAAVIAEPVMGNAGVIPPAVGFLEHLRQACSQHGIALIFDEVITGFRLDSGGAQRRYGVAPDLAVFGKAMASGFPVACVAGRREFFDVVSDGRVLHAGTFNSGPVMLAAAVATLRTIQAQREEIYPGLTRNGTTLMSAVQAAADRRRIGLLVQGLPQLFSLYFTDQRSVSNQAMASATDSDALSRFQVALQGRGIRVSGRGNLFLSVAHNEEVIAAAVDAFEAAIADYAAGGTG